MKTYAPILGFVTLAFIACGTPYSKKASLPGSLKLQPVRQFQELFVAIHDGGKTPMGVEKLTARCEAPHICRARVKDEKTNRPFVQLVGLQKGSTTLHISYFHPVLKKIIHEKISVVVASVTALPRLEVGQPMPTGSTYLYRLEHEDGTKVDALCEPRVGTTLPSFLVQPGDAHVRCRVPLNLGEGIYAVRDCRGFCPLKYESRHRFLCVQKTGANVSAVTTFLYDARSGKYEKHQAEGSPLGVICRMKQ